MTDDPDEGVDEAEADRAARRSSRISWVVTIAVAVGFLSLIHI